MIQKVVCCLCVITAVSLLAADAAWAERRTIAFSDKQGVEVQINAPAGVNWCQRTIPIFVLANDPNYFQDGKQTALMTQVSQILTRYCPSFAEAYVEGRVKGTNVLIYQGTAAADKGWALSQVFLKPLDRAERLAIRDRTAAQALYISLQSAGRAEKLAKVLDKDLPRLSILRDVIGRSIITGEAQLVDTLIRVDGDGTTDQAVLWPPGLTASIKPGVDPLTKGVWYLVRGTLMARIDEPGGYPGGTLIIERWHACIEEGCAEANDPAGVIRMLYPKIANDIIAKTGG